MVDTGNVAYHSAFLGAVIGGLFTLVGAFLGVLISNYFAQQNKAREVLQEVVTALIDLTIFLDPEYADVKKQLMEEGHSAAHAMLELAKLANLLPKRYRYIAARIKRIDTTQPETVNKLLDHAVHELNPHVYKLSGDQHREFVRSTKY